MTFNFIYIVIYIYIYINLYIHVMSLYMLHRFCGCFVIVLGEITAQSQEPQLGTVGRCLVFCYV